MFVPPSLSNVEGMFAPLQVNLHVGKPTKLSIIIIATNQFKKAKIVHEDATMDNAQIP